MANSGLIDPALYRPYLAHDPLPILQHAGSQPFLDEAHDAPVRDAVLDEPTNHSCESVSKRLRMSASSTQFTSLVMIPVRSPSEPLGEVLEIGFEVLAVGPPRLPVDSGCGIPLEAVVRRAETTDVVHVVQERGEPLFPVPSCGLTYPLERKPSSRSGRPR